MRFVSLASFVLDEAYSGVLADQLLDRNDPEVGYAHVSMNSIPHIGVSKTFTPGSRLAHIDLAPGAGDVTFVHSYPVPNANTPEYVSVFRKGTTDGQFDAYHRLDIVGPFELQWNSEVGIPLDIVGLDALTRAVHERLDA